MCACTGWRPSNLRVLALAVLATNSFVFAQSRQSEITGRVMDGSQASISGAAVSVTNEETGVELSAVTNEAGLYRVSNLVPGPYRVEIKANGFKTYVRRQLAVEVGQVARVDFVLELGDVKQQIVIEATAPLLKTESVELGQTVSARDMRLLPVLNRAILYLTLLDANAAGGPVGFGWTPNIAGNYFHGTGFYINGAQQGQRVDAGPPDLEPTADVVSEYRVLSNAFSAEFRGNKAVVVETKSGTNQFHGTGYFWIRDDSMNARPWGSVSKPPLRQTEPGFTLGGPIFKNKTFFFAAYQRRHIPTNTLDIFTIPTMAQRKGDFSQSVDSSGKPILVYDPATTRPDPARPGNFIRDPFPQGMIQPARLDPVAVAMLSFLPAPNQPGTATGAFNYNGFEQNDTTTVQYNARIDHQWSSKHRSFGSVLAQRSTTALTSAYGVPGLGGGGLVGNGDNTGTGNTSVYTFAHTYTPSSRWVSDTRFSMYQSAGGYYNNGQGLGYPKKLGLKGVLDDDAHFPYVSLAGYEPFGGANLFNLNFNLYKHTYSFAQKMSYSRGKQTFKFGYELNPTRNAFQNRALPSGWFSFDTNPTALPATAGTGNSVASALLGMPTSAQLQTRPDRKNSLWWNSLFVADEWRLAPNFLVSLGLRWETDSPEIFRRFDTGALDLTSFDRSKVNPVSGTPGIITYAGKDAPEGLFRQSYTHFQPRVGFNWQIAPKTVIRSGAGIYFNNPISGDRISFPEVPNYGISGSIAGNFVSPDNGITPPFLLRNGFPAIPAGEAPGPGFGAVAVGSSPRLNVLYIDNPAYNQGYNIQWNFTVERLLRQNLLGQVSYLGNKTTHMTNFTEDNQLLPSQFGPGNAQIRRPFPQYGSVTNGLTGVFDAKYHAFEAKLEKRYSAGLTFTGSFVFNKWLSNRSPWNRYDFKSAYRPQLPQKRFVTSWTYELPWGPGKQWLKNGVVARVLGGWSQSGILTLQSGGFSDVTYVTNTSNAFLQGNQGVNVIGNPWLPGDQRTTSRYFDTSAFAAPAPYTLGNAGRGILQQPGTVLFDASFTKDTRITERFTLSIRGDFFNFLNHPNLGGANGTFGSPAFGRIGSKSGNREAQLGVVVRF